MDRPLLSTYFSCRYEKGQTHILLGSSGCGKTTLLRLVLGMIAPDTGWVMVDGRPMSDLTRVELVGKDGLRGSGRRSFPVI